MLEFFAFWYLLAAFFILTGDAHRPDDHFCECAARPPSQQALTGGAPQGGCCTRRCWCCTRCCRPRCRCCSPRARSRGARRTSCPGSSPASWSARCSSSAASSSACDRYYACAPPQAHPYYAALCDAGARQRVDHRDHGGLLERPGRSVGGRGPPRSRGAAPPAQLFYVSCVVLYFRRLKKMEREIQPPPEVYKCP